MLVAGLAAGAAAEAVGLLLASASASVAVEAPILVTTRLATIWAGNLGYLPTGGLGILQGILGGVAYRSTANILNGRHLTENVVNGEYVRQDAIMGGMFAIVGKLAGDLWREFRKSTEPVPGLSVPSEPVPIEGACSFSADTDVSTANGPVDISQLKLGDVVWAYNEDTGEVGSYPITAIFEHLDPVIVELTIDGETITTTPEHPFYTEDRGWIGAGDLVIGEEIRSLDGGYGAVTAVEIVSVQQWMYNLTVDEAHTFFVGDEGWLVHNKCKYDIEDLGRDYAHDDTRTRYRINEGDTGERLAVDYLDPMGVEELKRFNPHNTFKEGDWIDSNRVTYDGVSIDAAKLQFVNIDESLCATMGETTSLKR